MSIVLKHMAKVDLRGVSPDTKAVIMQMYTYTNRYSGETFYNYVYKDGIIFIPPNWDKIQKVASILNMEIVDERSKGSPLGEPFVLQPEFKLRDYQVEPVKQLIDHVKEHKYSTLKAGTGTGKTLVITRVYGELNGKVIIFIDQSNLAGAWIEAADLVWGKKVQKIKAGDTTFSDVCIITFQLAARNKELMTRIRSEFSTGVCDEAHVSTAFSYKKVLASLDNQYRISCSASFFKKGFGTQVLEDFLSSVSVEMSNPEAPIPEIRWVNTETKWLSETPMDYASYVLPSLAADEDRNAIVIDLIKKCAQEGHITAVLAITIKQAQAFHEAAIAMGIKSEMYTGTTTMKRDKEIYDLIDSKQIQLLLTVSKVLKGSNFPNLSALILVKPNNSEKDAIQAVGRVTRMVKGKPQPVVYDLRDSGPLAETFARNRNRFYKKLGYTIATT